MVMRRQASIGRIVAGVVIVLGFLAKSQTATGEEFQLLWPDGAPEAKGTAAADQPGVWVYPAGENSNGAAVVICPGGGYGVHAVDHEGVQPAKWFNSIGVTAFVLRYRLSPYRHPVPLMDAQRALRWVRSNAATYNVDPTRVGIMGFSAGGHLASTAATHFDDGDPNSADPIQTLSSRPSFAILGYPVVTMKPDYTHMGSQKNLLGDAPAPEMIENLSNETQVTPQTPPIFFFHTAEDTAVPPQNSVQMFLACLKAGVPAELHVFQHGQHGVGLAFGHPALSKWIELCGIWLRQNGFLTERPQVAVRGQVMLKGMPMPWGSISMLPESSDLPIGWSMVMGGNYSIPETAGLIPGTYKIKIVNMGNVAPQPTTADASEVPVDLTVEIESDKEQQTTAVELKVQVQ